jgi:hypothetical protein
MYLLVPGEQVYDVFPMTAKRMARVSMGNSTIS